MDVNRETWGRQKWPQAGCTPSSKMALGSALGLVEGVHEAPLRGPRTLPCNKNRIVESMSACNSVTA